MRIGVVGYGTGGQNFHTPFIEAADGVELVGVVARSPERKAAVARDWPEVPIYESLTDLLSAGVDAVTITTPPATRRDLVLEAVAAGVHVIADKPFAPTAAAARELHSAAEDAGVLLSVYHNRRWDADIRTLQKIIEAGHSGNCGGCTHGSTPTIRRHSKPDRKEVCSATSVPTWSIRCCGCWVLPQR